MTKLHQINALVTGRKSEVEKVVGDIYKVVQKPELFNGMSRSYHPYKEEGEKLPAEAKRVQQKAASLLEQAREKWQELWDLTAQQDAGNQSAKADIIVDGKVVVKEVPVTTLLFLEKQINDLETFINRLPTPNEDEDWSYDASLGVLKTAARETVRTRKEPAHYVKAEATKEHPAQVEFYHKDVGVGLWSQTTFSGAIQYDKKQTMLKKVKQLRDAIKIARETANSIEVQKIKIADNLFDFVME